MQFGFNTILVLISAAAIGIACSIIGTYILLYKKTLVSDAASHATLPGIALGFLLALSLGINDGRFLPLLLAGGAITGYICSWTIEFIIRQARLHEDTAIASALAFFFGLGIVLFSIIQNLEGGNKSGIDSFLFGQIAGITALDAAIIISGSIIVCFTALLFGKNFVFFSFDYQFSKLQLPQIQKLQNLLMLLMMIVVCLGLKTIGAILILALLIIPPATGRLLQDNVSGILKTSALCGLASSIIGSLLSLHISNLPTGSAIIIISLLLFMMAFIANKMRENYGRRIL